MTIDTDARTHAELARACSLLRERILEEAENREWCSEFEDFVRDINATLGWELLVGRRRLMTVTATVQFDVDNGWDSDGLTQQLYRAVTEHAGELVNSLANYDVDIHCEERS